MALLVLVARWADPLLRVPNAPLALTMNAAWVAATLFLLVAFFVGFLSSPR